MAAYIVEKGRDAEDVETLTLDWLLEQSMDEPASWYPRLATAVAVDPAYRWVQFRLDPEAHWHDGAPLTSRDVAFTFDAIRGGGRGSVPHGAPGP